MMKKRWAVLLGIAGVMLFSALSFAADAPKEAKKPAAMSSWTGEVVDMGCYTGHGATGEKHGKECGSKCVANGMPMGLLTKDGKVHVLCLNHDNADPYNQLKAWVGSQVEVSGTHMSRGGISAIEVDGAKPATAAK